MKELHTQIIKSNPGVYIDTASTLSSSVKYSNAVYKLSNPRSFASPQLPLPLLHQAILPKPHYQFQKPTKFLNKSPPNSTTTSAYHRTQKNPSSNHKTSPCAPTNQCYTWAVAIPRTSSSNPAWERETDSRAQSQIFLGREGARGSAITPADD